MYVGWRLCEYRVFKKTYAIGRDQIDWYYRQFRVNANIILADTKRDVASESNGHALGLRMQYLF